MSRPKRIVRLHAEQDGKCYFCKCDTHVRTRNQKKIKRNTATIEHLIPKSKGGTNVKSNLKMSCHQCNSLRGNMCAVEWLRIVNDPKKLAAFRRVSELKKEIKRQKRRKKFIKSMLDKYGIYYSHISMPHDQFMRVFRLQTA